MSSEQALKELGLAEHQLRFTCRVHLHDSRKEQETAMRVYSHLKRWAQPGPGGGGGQRLSGSRWGLTVSPRSLLKDHCVQHLPDGSVTVESILIQAAAHSEDPGTKVLLVSWTYQVCTGPRKLAQSSGSGQVGSPLQPGLPRSGGRNDNSCVPL